MEKKPLYGVKIERIKLLELVSDMGRDISTHSMSHWMKSVTANEYVVVPRNFVVGAMEYIEKNKKLEFIRMFI